MDLYNEMDSMLTDEFSIMNEDSLILGLGGMSHALAATGSCGSSGSSRRCDATSVCNCSCPIVIK